MRMIFGSRKFALTCTQLRCWATVALQSKHQHRRLQSCSCTCWSSWCSICRSCRHTPLWSRKPQSSSLALAPWSRTLVKNIRHVCEHICDYSLWGCCTSNMEFKAVLRQLCLLMLEEHSSQSLVWAMSSWSKEQVCKWDIENDSSTYRPGQTQSNTTNAAFLPSRPPRPSIWESSQTSLGSPGNDNRYQVKRRWRITNANSQSDIWYVTSHASALSADEQSAIPEIRWWITPESFCIQPTQSARQPSPSLSPPLCCHHWASLCGRGRSQAYQGAPQYPWPIQLMINDKRKCHVAQHLVFNQSHMLTYSQIFLPMISAVSFLSTNIWTLIMAALSAKSGRTKARSLSMFLWHSDWLGNK